MRGQRANGWVSSVVRRGIAAVAIPIALATTTFGGTASADPATFGQYIRNVGDGLCLTDRGDIERVSREPCRFDAAGRIAPEQHWTGFSAYGEGPYVLTAFRNPSGRCLVHLDNEESVFSVGCQLPPPGTPIPNKLPPLVARQVWYLRIDLGARESSVYPIDGVNVEQERVLHPTSYMGSQEVSTLYKTRITDHRLAEWTFG